MPAAAAEVVALLEALAAADEAALVAEATMALLVALAEP